MSWNIIAQYRRLLSQETGAVIKDRGGKISVALAYPNSYYVGMSNLGFQALYGLLNAYPDVVCERVFLPGRDLAAEYEKSGTHLLSLETQRPVAAFDMLAFSLSHENDYPNLVRMLVLAGLAPRRDDRREGDPLVVAGGVCVRTNPEPLADFLDLALLGDGEIILPPLIRAWREVWSHPLPQTDRTLHLARNTPGAYAPASYEAAPDGGGRLIPFGSPAPDLPDRIVVARADTLPSPALVTKVRTPETEFSDTRLVEIGRGCFQGCRFCLAGFVYRPPRTTAVESVLEALGPPEKEGERVGLVSPAVADHPELEDVVRALTGQGREVTVSSLRVQALTPGLVEALALGKLRSAAVAPEAGSQRLRDVINKGLTETQILDGVSLLAEAGIRRLKLYFMIGLPLETDEDMRAAADLTLRIRDRLKKSFKGRRLLPEITLTLSSFVPKPHTPFETRPMADPKTLKARAKILREALRREKGVRVHFDPPRWSYLQAVFSLGDRRVGRLIESMAEGRSPAAARKAIDFDPDDFVLRHREDDEILPWSFIDHGVSRKFLRSEWARAKKGRATPSCRPETCRTCGVCPGNRDG